MSPFLQCEGRGQNLEKERRRKGGRGVNSLSREKRFNYPRSHEKRRKVIFNSSSQGEDTSHEERAVGAGGRDLEKSGGGRQSRKEKTRRMRGGKRKGDTFLKKRSLFKRESWRRKERGSTLKRRGLF